MKALIFFLVIIGFTQFQVKGQFIDDKSNLQVQKEIESSDAFRNNKSKFDKKVEAVSVRPWFNSSLTNLIALPDQNRIVEMTLLCPTVYNTEVWGEYYYLDIRRLSQEIEKREDNKDW